MVAIFTRSALEFWSGGKVAPEVHSVIIDHRGRRVVTYAEHMDAKRKHQAETLRRRLHVEPWRAWRLYVAYYDQRFYGGWHVMLDRYDCRREWLMRGKPCPELMRLFPLVLALGSEHDQWEDWKRAFATQYRRGSQCRKPRGFSIVWRRGFEIRKDRPEG